MISFELHSGFKSGLQAVEPLPLLLSVPPELTSWFRPRLQALEYHPEGDSKQGFGKHGKDVNVLEGKESSSNIKSLAKKKRSTRGKKRGKSKAVLQETQGSEVPVDPSLKLYDLDVMSSDMSESSQEMLDDSDMKKCRIEDKLWEEAFESSTTAPKSEEPDLNEESTLMDSSEFNIEANLLQGASKDS